MTGRSGREPPTSLRRGVSANVKPAPSAGFTLALTCGIRRETDYHRHNACRGPVGETFENLVARDFSADGPRQGPGTDVTGSKCSFGKACPAPACDFGSKEIVAWSVSESPNMAQQQEMLDMLLAAMPEGARPVMHSDSKNVISRFCDNRNGAVSCKPGPRRSILTRTPIDWPASAA